MKLIVPATIIVTIPKTRWCTWTPPLSMLPGHHGTRGLRISRVLMRMNRERADEADEHQEHATADRAQTSWSFQKSVMNEAAGMSIPAKLPS